MSEQKMASVADSTGNSRQSVQASHPVWMAHWMQPSSNAAGKQHQCRKGGSEDSQPAKESSVTETKTFEVVSSKVDEKKTSCWPDMKHRQINNDKQTSRQVFGHNIEQENTIEWKGRTQLSLWIPAADESSFERCNSVGEGTAKSFPERMKTCSSSTDRSIAVLKPSHGSTMELSTHIMPDYNLKQYECDTAQKDFDKGKASLIRKLPIVSKDQFPNSNIKTVEKEHCYKHGQQADLFWERRVDSHWDTGNDVPFRDINTSLFDTASSSHHQPPTLGQSSFQKMKNCSSCEMLRSQGISQKTESKKSCCNSCSLQKLSYCVHDMKTVRIRTNLDSVEATPEGFPMFSQTTSHVLITKDVHISKQNDVFKRTRLIAVMNGNKADDVHSPSPFFGQGMSGLELRSLSSSSNSKGKRNIEEVTASKAVTKNESSAETDSMDMDLFKEEISNSACTNHTPSFKGFNIDLPLSPQIDAIACGEARHNWAKAIPPNINLELPPLPATASSSKNVHRISSRTQSLDIDMDMGMPSAYPNKKSNFSLGDSSEASPMMRWVKRLKMRLPNSSSQGTKNSNLGKTSSPIDKNHFTRILESGIASTEPSPRSHHVQETIMSSKSRRLSKANQDFMADSTREGKESSRSQAWIKRWLQNRSEVTKNKAATVMCEPDNFKLALDDFQKQQVPSIAAMALMGKAMNRLESCVLQKQDSFTIWNTQRHSGKKFDFSSLE